MPLERALACLQQGPATGPRGLSPLRLLDEVGAGGLDLARLARLLEPPAEGPWYRAAREGDGGPGPEALAGALAVCCAARGADSPFVLAAAASLALLTHSRPEAIAGACVAALAAWETALGGALASLDERALLSWSIQARERTGAAPPAHVLGEVRRAAAGVGVPGTVSGALQGLARGTVPDAGTPLGLQVERLLEAGGGLRD
jgi:hypothetical protein